MSDFDKFKAASLSGDEIYNIMQALKKTDHELASAIQLIKDITHLNYYGEVSDLTNRWLKEHGYGDEK